MLLADGFAGEDSVVVLFSHATQPIGDGAELTALEVPHVRSFHLLEPVAQVKRAKIVEGLAIEFHQFAGFPIFDRVGLSVVRELTVECLSLHQAVQIAQTFWIVTDQIAYLAASVERECEPLKFLGAVDRVEEAGACKAFVVTPFFEAVIDADSVGQITLLGV